MERLATQKLIEWNKNTNRKPLIARFDNVGFGCGAVLCERGGGKRYKKLRTAGG